MKRSPVLSVLIGILGCIVVVVMLLPKSGPNLPVSELYMATLSIDHQVEQEEFGRITPTSFSFAVVGDTRCKYSFFNKFRWGVNEVRTAIVDKTLELKPAFVLNTGDLVLRGSNTNDWQEFDAINYVFKVSGIGYYPVLGNHDYEPDRGAALDNYFQRFPYIQRQWYTFTYCNSAFIMLDSNFGNLSDAEHQEQNRWLAETVTSYQNDSSIAFVFACTHYSPYTNCIAHEPAKQVQDEFVPVLAKASKVKFVFTGHSHTYERFRLGQINYVVTGGGGAPLKDTLEPAKWRYRDEYDSTGAKPRGNNFCIVTVHNDSLSLQSFHLQPEGLSWTIGETLKEP